MPFIWDDDRINDLSPTEEINALYGRITQELNKVIVGQDQIVRHLLAIRFILSEFPSSYRHCDLATLR